MLSKRLALLPVVALLSAACSTGASPSPAVATPGASPPVAPSATQQVATSEPSATAKPFAGVKLTMWMIQSDPQPLQDVWARWAKETGATLDLVRLPSDGFETALTTRWAGGERPDILEWHSAVASLKQLNAAETMQDLSGEPYIAKSGTLYKDNMNLDGKVYGLVMGDPAQFGLFYNTDVFARLGLTPPTSFDELISICKQIRTKDPSIAPMFEAAGSGWPPYIFIWSYQDGALYHGWLDKLNARTVRLDGPDSPVLAALRAYGQAAAAGCFNKNWRSAVYEDSYKALADGTAAMVSQHSGILLDMRTALGDASLGKVGFTAWSGDGPVVGIETNPSGNFMLPKTGDPAREAAARSLLEYMAGPAYQDYLNGTGQYPTIDGFTVPSNVPQALVQAHQFAKQNGSVSVWVDALPPFDISPIDKVIAGTMTPEEAVKKLQVSANEGAKAAGLPVWP